MRLFVLIRSHPLISAFVALAFIGPVYHSLQANPIDPIKLTIALVLCAACCIGIGHYGRANNEDGDVWVMGLAIFGLGILAIGLGVG